MELYKDPDGKNISLMATHGGNSTRDNNTTSEGEIKELQRRVIELETCLKQYVSKLACLEPTKQWDTHLLSLHITKICVHEKWRWLCSGLHVLFIVPSLIVALYIAAQEHSCIFFLTLRCCVAM